MLLFSQYTVLRNIRKFKQRSGGGNAKVFSEKVVQSMVDACNCLTEVSGKDIYTDKDVSVEIS